MSLSSGPDETGPADRDHGTNPTYPLNWVPVLEKAIDSPRKLRVVCVGAGFAGLTLAYQLKKMNMEAFLDFRIYEKNSGVGGTWFENRYPGLVCDVPARKLIKRWLWEDFEE